MVERDPLERRNYAPTIPSDLEDPPQFGQVVETTKDAIVLELREFFDQPKLNTQDVERRREVPTVRKYAVGFAPGTDPYETTQQIVQDHADVGESLPHVAVTAVQGTNNRLTAGQPIIAHVQHPPRVQTTLAEPYALGASATEKWDLVVSAAVVGFRYVATLNGQDYEITGQPGEDEAAIARRLRDALRATEPLVRLSQRGETITVTASEVNTPFTLTVSANLTAAQLIAAGIAATDSLTYRTLDDARQVVTETVTFYPSRFPLAAPASAALAVDVARVFNEQAQHAWAEVIDVGGSPGVRFRTRGRTPDEIEILPETSANLRTALGLGSSGSDITISGTSSPFTVTATGLGTATTASVEAGVSAYVHLTGMPTTRNDGRFQVATIVDADTITIHNPAARAETAPAAAWFVGARDDYRNPARPVMTRRHLSFRLTVSISALSESPNTRNELHDLVLSQFAYYLELKHFQLYGRGTFEPETYPDEHWQISIGQDIAPSGQAKVERGGDPKDAIYEGRISLPVTLFMYQDRSVLVPSGPNAGQSWQLSADSLQPFPPGTNTAAGTIRNDFAVCR